MSKRFSVIGQSRPKIDAWAKVTGETKYADDLVLPRMAYGKLLRSPHPHARIVRIDTTRAAALPGVYAVITGYDLPRVKFGILPVSQDEEALCTDKVRMVGDPVAAVAALDEETAERATELIEVEYEPLRPLMSIEDSLGHPEVRIHEYGDRPNVHKAVSLQFGDVEAAFAAADLVREDVFFYEGNTHLPMEQHAAVAQWTPDGKLTLWSSTQTPHYVHRALGRLLVDGGHRGHRIAHHADFLRAQRFLVLRNGQDPELDARKVGAGDHGIHAGQRARTRRLDAPDPGVRVGAAQEATVGQPRQGEIVGVARLTRDLAPGVDLRQWLANHREAILRRHRVAPSGVGRLSRSAASSTASRIFVYPVQRQRLPASASLISCRVGVGESARSAWAVRRIPGVQ